MSRCHARKRQGKQIGLCCSIRNATISPRWMPTTLGAMATSNRMKRPEAAIQRAVFQHLRARGAPNVFAFHPANGGFRRPTEAAIMKGLGVVPGVPDVIAIHQGRCYAMELKAEGGRATDKQLACIAALEAAGAHTCIAEGVDRALQCLGRWRWLEGWA